MKTFIACAVISALFVQCATTQHNYKPTRHHHRKKRLFTQHDQMTPTDVYRYEPTEDWREYYPDTYTAPPPEKKKKRRFEEL